MHRKSKMTRTILSLLIYMSLPLHIYGISDFSGIRIGEIITEIDGSTKRSALLREIKLYQGARFESREILVDFLDSALQNLVNMRVFEEVSYTLEESGSDGDIVDYKVTLSIKDSITFYPIPYPKYNSNTGGRLGLHLYYYNMFGTLVDGDLSGNVDFMKNDINGKITVQGWHVTPLVEGLPLGNLDVDLKYSHKYITESPRGDLELPDGSVLENTIIKKDAYHNDSLSAGTEIAIASDFFYRMSPEIGFNYAVTGYMTNQTTGELEPYSGNPADNPDLDIMYLSWTHSLGYDTVDWNGNFRNGFSAEIINNLNISTDFLKTDPLHFSASITGEVKYFWRINKYLSFSTMGTAMVSFNKRMEDLGDRLRGVRDEQLFGDKALFLSLDLSVSAINWDGVGELIIIPYFNMGYVRNDMIRDYEMGFAQRDSFVYSAGLDVVVYIDKLNALTMRGSIGVDLGQYSWDSADKWEIDIDTALSY